MRNLLLPKLCLLFYLTDLSYSLIGSLFLLFDGLLKAFLKQRQFRHQIGDCAHESVFWRVIGGGLNANYELVLERMWNFIAGEKNFRIFEELTEN